MAKGLGGRGAAPVQPRRSLGQNFLRARWVAEAFAAWACRFTRLAEVGVGGGALTSVVASKCRPSMLVGLEVDKRLLDHIAALSFFYTCVESVQADALSPPLRWSGVEAVYGSIPYNITGPLLSMLAVEVRLPAMLLLQREVARRLVAGPGSRSYGRITVLVQLAYSVKLGRVVPPKAFEPPPRVYSQLVYLEPRSPAPSPDLLRRVEELTRCLFSERNKVADKVAAKCTGRSRGELAWLRGRRVYELSPVEVARLAETV